MTQTDFFDQPEPERRRLARQGRDEGAERAARHADAVNHEWRERAYTFVVQFARRGGEFMCGDVRAHAERCGMSLPPDKRAWGAVMLRAARAGLVQRVGYATASDPKVHCSVNGLWRAA